MTETALVELALEARKIRIRRIPAFRWGQPSLAGQGRHIPAAILKTRLIPLQIVQSGRHFLRRSARGKGNLQP